MKHYANCAQDETCECEYAAWLEAEPELPGRLKDPEYVYPTTFRSLLEQMHTEGNRADLLPSPRHYIRVFADRLERIIVTAYSAPGTEAQTALREAADESDSLFNSIPGTVHPFAAWLRERADRIGGAS